MIVMAVLALFLLVWQIRGEENYLIAVLENAIVTIKKAVRRYL